MSPLGLDPNELAPTAGLLPKPPVLVDEPKLLGGPNPPVAGALNVEAPLDGVLNPPLVAPGVVGDGVDHDVGVSSENVLGIVRSFAPNMLV